MKDPSLANAVVENSLDGLAVVDRDGRYKIWNKAMERFAGKTAAEVLGRRAFDVFPFLREHGLERAFERALAGEAVATEGVEHIEADGTRKVYDRLYLPLRSESEITGVLAIVRDATSRYAAQDALQRSEASLRMATVAARIGLWSWNPATDVATWDATMCALFGRPPEGPPRSRDEYLSLVHPDDRERSSARIARWRTTPEWEDEYRIVRTDGAVRWVMSKARVLRTDGNDLVLGALLDITERKERDERQRATQRLEVVGQLTAGIAHNFNNLLMGLLPNLEMAAQRAPEELVPLLREAEQSGQRAADVVRHLMTYAGRNHKSLRRVEPVAPLVERTVAFCRTTFERRIRVEASCETGAAASIDAAQFEQALLNLLINARDALQSPALASPTIAVSASCLPASAPELGERAGEWVCIRVTDNGAGMDAATLQRIGEPFFTTKEAGRGTGLGLATTQGIVREHGGFMTCHSEPGRGTTFALFVPRASPGPLVSEKLPIGAPSAGAEHGFRATILIVDDDEPVRRIVARLLQEAGFDVEGVGSGEAAIERVADPAVAARICVALLDVSMPGMSGRQLRARLRQLLPGAQVAFLTGYPFEPEEGDTLLEKPLTREKLVSAVRGLVAAR